MDSFIDWTVITITIFIVSLISCITADTLMKYFPNLTRKVIKFFEDGEE